jgi:hypothetical protein
VNDTPERRKIFEAVVEVGEDGFLQVHGGNFTNREWKVDTFSQAFDDGEVDLALVIRGRVRGEVVPGAAKDGGAAIRLSKGTIYADAPKPGS